MAIGKLWEVVIDCRDCDRLADFWAAVLGGTTVRESEEWVAIAMADGSTTVSFQEVPEEKVVKNRVHLDVLVEDLDEAADRCIALGDTRISDRQGDSLGDFIVLCDPEGNEFCVVTN